MIYRINEYFIPIQEVTPGEVPAQPCRGAVLGANRG
jgi:hypothetical protein